MLAVLVLVLIAGAVYSLISLFGATAWLRHTSEVRLEVARVGATLLDAETSVRGYIASDDPSLLGPYNRAMVTWPGRLDRLRALTSDNSVQQERLQQLRSLVGRQLDSLRRARAMHEAGVSAAMVAPILRDENREMEAARALLAEMETEEVRLDAARRIEATRQRAAAAGLFALGAFMFLGFMTYMGRQRRASEASRARADDQRRLLEAVFAGIQDGITLQDRTGKIVFANASAARTIGFESPQALMAAPTEAIMQRFELFDGEGNAFDATALPARSVLRGEPAGEGVLVRYRHRDRAGSWRWSVVESYPIHDADGKVIQAINVFRDVTDRRAAEERDKFLLSAVDKLTSSLDYEETLSAVAHLAVPTLADWCAVDLAEDGLPKRVATAHVDPAKVAAVMEIARRYPPDPNAHVGLAELLRTGQPQLIPRIPPELLTAAAVDEEHLRLIDALGLWSYMAVPLSIGGKVLGAITFAMAESHRTYGEADLAFARALADRAALAIENARLFREVEEARAAMTDRLEEEEERRAYAEERTRFAETFVGMLGHDLRNPLNAVSITARLLLRSTSDQRDRRAVERILTSAQRMSNMVTQLLDLTRSRLAGGISLQRGVVDLGAVVSEVVDELRRAFPGRNIVWVAPADVRISADRDRLAQVISNLIGNALEHGDAEHPVTIALAEGTDVALIVHNEGPAIAPEVMPILFEPFRAVRGERSRGLGLGLFITEQIVVAHGGQIEVSSSAERGTTFVVHLPRFVNDEHEQHVQKVVP